MNNGEFKYECVLHNLGGSAPGSPTDLRPTSPDADGEYIYSRMDNSINSDTDYAVSESARFDSVFGF